MKKVGLVVNSRKPLSGELLKDLKKWFQERDIEAVVLKKIGEKFEVDSNDCVNVELLKELDMIITLGGDGTLLGTARLTVGAEIPILGINFGHIGFLTDVELADLFTSLERILSGDFDVEPRMMLKAEVLRQNSSIEQFHALNDVVITKGPLSRIIALETYLKGEYLATYRADGLIIASPTGSTAYSLSAGGPIVSPKLNVIILTPICPHSLYSRPIILDDDQVIEIVLKSDSHEVMLTVDGQVGFRLQDRDKILVHKANFATNLIRLHKRSFFELLRHKLQEGNR